MAKYWKPKPKDTLGISRNKMPQVKEKNYPEYLKYLQDNKISMRKKVVDPTKYKAIQKEFSDDGIQIAVERLMAGKIKPCLVSVDGYVIDGHHRWLAAIHLKRKLNVIKINAPVKKVLDITRKFPKTIYKQIGSNKVIANPKPFAESFISYLTEAEYEGRKVKLNDPFRNSDGKSKFSVYVRGKKGKVIKVNFGDPNMEIKRDNPASRKSFRARHNCADKTDKTTAGYWSCKMWEKGKTVSELD